MKRNLMPYILAILAMLVMLPALWVNTVPADDATGRYAPMARAFAEGNWTYAFHPHSGIVFSTLSGSIAWITGLDGFRSCQLAALLTWALAVIPLYFIALRMWNNRETAWICGVLYLLCSHLQRYVYDGIRDNGRSLGFFLLVLGLLIFYEERNSWKAVILTSLGAALLAMLRVDCVVFAVLGFGCFGIWDMISHRWRCGRSLVLGSLILLLIAPQLYLNYRWSGYPVPNSRYALLLEKYWGEKQ